ncbi:DUF4870 domain-containing protein [Demequina sp. NBRC 110057]|uniref:DUF4870 domain-containing protein n=1 Tax=Demequina sp. NBRC 110057 TaxID=1570346 RepID=UPI00135634BC|nr:DUF4870 domain-containing protein [Demequina sp. NBRC 110057]
MTDSTPQGSFPPPPPQQPYPQPPHQPMLESDARMYSMLIHLVAGIAAVVSAGFLGFVAPLVIWLIFRQRSALVDFHGKQQLNLQITGLIVGVAAVIISIATLGIGMILALPAWLAYWVYSIVVSFIAATKANAGEYSPIRFTIPFFK